MVVFHGWLSREGCLSLSVVFHEGLSFIEGCLSWMVVFHGGLSMEGCLSSRVVFHRGLSFMDGCLS